MKMKTRLLCGLIPCLLCIVTTPFSSGEEGVTGVLKAHQPGHWKATMSQKLISPTAGEGDGFGQTVVMTEDRIWIGAPNDDTAGIDVGAVHLFKKDFDTWVHENTLLPSNPDPGQYFGACLAVDPDHPEMLAIGSPRFGTDLNFSGAAYLFEQNEIGDWNQLNCFIGESTHGSGFFGCSVDIDDDTLVVSAQVVTIHQSWIVGLFMSFIYRKPQNR